MSSLPAGWASMTVGDIVSAIVGGISVPASDRPCKQGEHGILTLSAVSYGHFDPSANKAVTNGAIDGLGRTVRAKTVLISRSNTVELVGACAHVDQDYPTLHLPDLIWELSVNRSHFDTRWFYYALASPFCRLQIQNRATGTSDSMKKLSMASLRTVTFPVPPLAEQAAIAARLSVWDRSMRQLNDLIAVKARLKQGLVLQLLSGRQRLGNRAVPDEARPAVDATAPLGLSATAVEVERGLNGVSHDKGIPRLGSCPVGWKTRRLRELLAIVERPVALQPDRTYKLVTAKRYRAGIVPREELCGSQIKTATQCETKSGDFLISRRQIIHGACGLVPPPLDGAVVSNEYSCLRVSDELDPTFFEYLAYTKYLQRTFYQSSVGVALEKMIFRIDKWLDYEIHLPPLPEQKRIVAVLNAIDREIVLLDRLQKSVAKQKKGLMQKLLTGQVRVKLSKGDT